MKINTKKLNELFTASVTGGYLTTDIERSLIETTVYNVIQTGKANKSQ